MKFITAAAIRRTTFRGVTTSKPTISAPKIALTTHGELSGAVGRSALIAGFENKSGSIG
jgi:hypothetical protein